MNILWCLMSLRQFLEAHSFGGLPDFFRTRCSLKLQPPQDQSSTQACGSGKSWSKRREAWWSCSKSARAKPIAKMCWGYPDWRLHDGDFETQRRERDGPKRSQISRILQLFVVDQVRDWLLTTTCWLLPVGQIASGGQGHATHVARIGVADADDRIRSCENRWTPHFVYLTGAIWWLFYFHISPSFWFWVGRFFSTLWRLPVSDSLSSRCKIPSAKATMLQNVGSKGSCRRLALRNSSAA